MQAHYEIIGKFEDQADCSALLYAPLADPLTYRRSIRYELEFDGDQEALSQFVRRTLVDAISQDVFEDTCPWEDETFFLEYGMKPSALDLEKEAILTFYHSLKDPGFTLHKLAIRQRIYVFGSASPEIAKRFVRDLVNPAIHTHSLSASV